MSDWLKEGNTAVITGGASGIGLEAARHYASAGMHVVIADRNEDALRSAQVELEELAISNDHILCHRCDVTNLDDVEALRDVTLSHFDAVHCLMNNAGAGIPVASPWESIKELKTTMEINLWGIIHGCHAFIPGMLASDQRGVVINTGSKQGITRPPGNYAYNLSKAGVLAYTESIAQAFTADVNCKLSAHLLVPGFVFTPMISQFIAKKPPSSWTAEQTIDFMLPCIDRGDFYIICPDNETSRAIDEKRIQWNADDLIKNRPALSRWHPDYKREFEDFMAN